MGYCDSQHQRILWLAAATARRDRDRGLFAVYPATGGLVIVGKRSEATELAQKLNGSWTRIPR